MNHLPVLPRIAGALAALACAAAASAADLSASLAKGKVARMSWVAMPDSCERR